MENTAKKHKKKYIKPEYKIETIMTFPFDLIKNFKHACRQCSSCHGCR